MFSRAMDRSVLSPWTDEGMFESVSAPVFRDGYSDRDYSMIAVAKALYSRRLSEGEQFNIYLTCFCDDGNVDRVADNINALSIGANEVYICNFRSGVGRSDEKAKEIAQKIEEEWIPNHPGWAVHKKADAFLNNYFICKVVINENNNSGIVFTNHLTMQHWHVLISMLPAFTPALFKEIPLEEAEKRMSQALTMRTTTTFLEKLSALEEKYNIRERKIANLVGGFEKREHEMQLNTLEVKITQIRNKMEELMDRYSASAAEMQEANIRRNGLKYAIDNADENDELVKFFQANKSLDVIGVNGSVISFIVKTYFDNYDQEEYETYRNNPRFIEESEVSGVFRDPEARKKVMDAMFIKHSIRLLMCAVYHLDIRGRVSTTSDYTYPANCKNYIPNYHLDHHSCFGNYGRIIPEYLERGDTIGAINACIASAKSVNIAESGPTFNPMMQKVFTSTKECFELPDGRRMTPAKVLEWLNEQEKEQENEQEKEQEVEY